MAPDGPVSSTDAAPGLAARLGAWRVLEAVAAGAYADVALERELARHPLPPADRGLVTELAYGAIRQRRLLDAWLEAHGRVAAHRQPPRLRWLLHLGLYQILFTRRVPAAAAVSTSVELAKRAGLGRLATVVNGLLRAVLRRRADLPPSGREPEPWEGLMLPTDPVAAYGLRHSLPDWLAAEVLGHWLPPDAAPGRAEAFGRACNAPPPLDLRVNPLRISRAELLEAFAVAGHRALPLEGLPQGITLPERPGDLRALPGYGEGSWSVQDRRAQRIAPLLDPRPGMAVLDACAAPGGKATHLAERMADRGEVWAVDRSEARLGRVRANAGRLGLEAVRTLAADAAELPDLRPDWRGRFDRILLDVPCSGLGTLARHPDARWRIDPSAIDGLVALQGRLLAAGALLLAPGGRLVYATCTVHPRENGGVIAAFLADHPGWILAESRQWWPGEDGGGDGFFAAVLEPPGVRGAGGPTPEEAAAPEGRPPAAGTQEGRPAPAPVVA
ncbi:MAG: 16S rRNA (cytosine(967)-C(5))-methyltransferase [Synechococcaceae cyanobacterium]|nr:16S rRNA (cytosine(967)-C(5))-methyltransferase [Synechococcaceae cyanobacterium]